jgi:hypothetical protein
LRRAEAEVRAGGEQGQRLVVVQPGELGPEPGQQRESPVPAAFGVDRDTGRGQRFDVAQHGPGGHVQFPGEGVRGQPAALPQQQHQRDQAVGAHPETPANTRQQMS